MDRGPGLVGEACRQEKGGEEQERTASMLERLKRFGMMVTVGGCEAEGYGGGFS